VRAGVTLAELEAIRGGPISFTGFGWDYGGRAGWGDEAGGAAGGLTLELAPHPDSTLRAATDPRYPEVLGEDTVRSDHPLMPRLDVRVERITLRFAAQPGESPCPTPGP
jgi:hypothetical protein